MVNTQVLNIAMSSSTVFGIGVFNIGMINAYVFNISMLSVYVFIIPNAYHICVSHRMLQIVMAICIDVLNHLHV